MPTNIPFPPPHNAPAIEAARAVLLKRVAEVKKPLRRMRAKPGDDPEHVHKLRVATRRLGAALRIFETVLDRKPLKDLARAARRLRRAAGDARDLDVLESMFLARLQVDEKSTDDVVPGLRNMRGQKKRAYRKLVKALPGMQEDFMKAVSAVQRSWKRQPARSSRRPPAADQSCGDLSQQVMLVRSAAFCAAADADLSNFDTLHELRIATKRLRYSMEVFADCFPRSFFEEVYPGIERLQGELGDINDLRNLHTYLAETDDRATKRNGESVTLVQTEATVSKLIERELRLRTDGFLRTWPSRIAALRDELEKAFGQSSVPEEPAEPFPVYRDAPQRTGETVDR